MLWYPPLGLMLLLMHYYIGQYLPLCNSLAFPEGRLLQQSNDIWFWYTLKKMCLINQGNCFNLDP